MSRLSIDGERYIYTGNGKKMKVKVIGVFRLYLGINVYLELENIFVVSLFRWNLIYVTFLDKSGNFCSFENGIFNIFWNSVQISIGSLIDKLNKLNIFTSPDNEVMYNIGTKCILTNENSSMFCQKKNN